MQQYIIIYALIKIWAYGSKAHGLSKGDGCETH